MRKTWGKLGGGIVGPYLLVCLLFLMFSPAFCRSQGVCGPPSPPIVSPTTWIAGQTTTVTLTGNNWGCIAVDITDAESQVPWGNVPVTITGWGSIDDNNNTFTMIVEPDASVPTEKWKVWASEADPSCDGSFGTCWPPVYATVQIVNKCTPTITSISPSTWLAGETYKKVDITGTNFVTSDKATADCPRTQLTVTAGTGGVTVSGVHVSSDTKITATIKPDDDDPTEPATVIAKNGSSTGTATAQINGLPPAKIEWNDDDISGTTQSAVVGQKIELKAKPKEDLAEGYTLSKSTWVVDGTNIGELQEPAGNHGFKTGKTVLNKPDTSFYWLTQGSSLNASYTYCAKVPSGRQVCPQTTKATATFNVSGPTSVNLYPCDGVSLSGCTAGDPLPSAAIGHGERLQLGADGIMFTASDDTSSPTGKFSFVQLLDSYIMTYTYQYERPCTKNIADKGSGLDNYYPYPPITTTSTWDFPKVLLFGDDAEVTVSFQAGLFLMWESTGTSDSIPVSLGSLVWGWSGDAVQDQKSHDWSIKPTSGGPANVTSFVESSAYPQWAVIYHNPNGNDCAH